MADHDDDISPWERDDWTSSESPSFESLTAPADPDIATSADPASQMRALTDAPVDDQPSPGRPRGTQVWIAAAVGAVLLVGGVVALVRSDTVDRQAAGASDRQAAATVDTVPESGSVLPTDGAPTTTVGGGVPAFWNDDPAETTDSAADEPLAMGPSSVGEEPLWNTWPIDVPAPLDAMTEATEVVAFGADGILYRITLPSGQVRAMRMEDWESNAQAVVGEEAIVVFTPTDVSIVRNDEPIVSVPTGDEMIFVEAWPGTNQFIVTTLSPTGGEQQLTLDLDGTLAPIESPSVDGSTFWARAFLPDGRVVVNRPGGVYAVGIGQPATRLSDGDLLATGAAHYAVVECDAALFCVTFVIDAATGERTEAMLDALSDGSVFADPSTRISPDGRTIMFADRGAGIRRFLDAATGVTLDIGDVDGLNYPDSWASDSSGLFTEESGSIVFHPRGTYDRVVIEGLDSIASVATRRAVSGE